MLCPWGFCGLRAQVGAAGGNWLRKQRSQSVCRASRGAGEQDKQGHICSQPGQDEGVAALTARGAPSTAPRARPAVSPCPVTDGSLPKCSPSERPLGCTSRFSHVLPDGRARVNNTIRFLEAVALPWRSERVGGASPRAKDKEPRACSRGDARGGVPAQGCSPRPALGRGGGLVWRPRQRLLSSSVTCSLSPFPQTRWLESASSPRCSDVFSSALWRPLSSSLQGRGQVNFTLGKTPSPAVRDGPSLPALCGFAPATLELALQVRGWGRGVPPSPQGTAVHVSAGWSWGAAAGSPAPPSVPLAWSRGAGRSSTQELLGATGRAAGGNTTPWIRCLGRSPSSFGAMVLFLPVVGTQASTAVAAPLGPSLPKPCAAPGGWLCAAEGWWQC